MPTANIAYSALAAYNGGWTAYSQSAAYFGKNSSAYLAAAIRFTAPSYSGVPSSLSITVPIVNAWTNNGAMTCYYSLTTTDPTTLGTVYAASSPGTDSGRIASGTTTITGLTAALSYWTFTFTISSLTSGGTYYLVLGAASTTAYAASVYSASSTTGTLTYAYPASEPTLSSTTTAMGSSVTIYTNRADSSYTHTISYSFGGASGTIGTGVGASVSWTPPLTLAEKIPNATTGVGTITCQTYSGSTLYGTKTVTFYLTVPSSVVPTISSFTATRVDNGVPSDWGIYVRGVSKATLTTTASGVYSSTIKSYSITGGLSGSSVTTATLTTAGTNTWTVTVTDSRGRTASKSVSVDVVDYSTPTISGVTFERCDSDGTPNDDGTYIQAKATIAISSCDGLNSYTATVQYKLTTASTWTSAGTYDTSGTAQVYDVSLTDSAYDVRLVVTDEIQSVYSGATMDIGTVIMEYDPDNNWMTMFPDLVLDSGIIRSADGKKMLEYDPDNDRLAVSPTLVLGDGMDAGGGSVTNLPTPTDNTDAVPKSYVDSGFLVRATDISVSGAAAYTSVSDNWSSLPSGPWCVRIAASSPPYSATAVGYKTGDYGAYLYMDYYYNYLCRYQAGTVTNVHTYGGNLYSGAIIGSGAISTTSTITATGNITSSGKLLGIAIELSYSTPFIDFHYGESTADYTQRILSSSSSGNLIAYPGISASSDERLKNSIVDLPEVYAQLFDALTLREFRMNRGNGLRIGLIAQEILEAEKNLGISESVIVSGTGEEDEDGNIDYYAVDYNAVSVLAMAKIKEMDAEIQELKARIAALEN